MTPSEFPTWSDTPMFAMEHHVAEVDIPDMFFRLNLAMEGAFEAATDLATKGRIGPAAHFYLGKSRIISDVYLFGEDSSDDKGFLARSWDRICEFFSKIWKAITDFFKSKTMDKKTAAKKTAHLRQRYKRVKDGGTRAAKDGDNIKAPPVSAWWSKYTVIDEALITKSLEEVQKVDEAIRGIAHALGASDSHLRGKLAELVKAGDIRALRKDFYSTFDKNLRAAASHHTSGVIAEALRHEEIIAATHGYGTMKPSAEGSRVLEMANFSAGLFFVNLDNTTDPIQIPVFIKNVSGEEKNGAVHAMTLDGVERMLDDLDKLIDRLDVTQQDHLSKAIEDTQQVSDALMEAVTESLRTGEDSKNIMETVRYMAKYISSYATACNKVMISQRHTWDMAAAYVNKSLE